MVKILFDLQISSYEHSKGMPLIQSDSNWIFTTSIIKALESQGITCKLLYGQKWPLNVEFPCEQIGFINYRRPEEDRFFLDQKVISQALQFKPDIIWTNDPCKVGSYRSFFSGKIIAYNHWIDNPIDPKVPPLKSYYWRQAESYFKADYLLFNSIYGMQHFKDGLSKYITDRGNYPTARLGYVNPPLRTAIIKEVFDSTYLSKELTIAFNHRLSSASQYQTAIDNLILMMNSLDKKKHYYQILVSNPSGKYHPILNHPSVVNIHNQDYREYLEKLSTAWFQITPFAYPGQWSMAMAEALCLGIKVISTQSSGYSEVDKFRYSIPFNNSEFAAEIVRNDNPIKNKNQANAYLQEFDPDNIVEKQLIPKIKELI